MQMHTTSLARWGAAVLLCLAISGTALAQPGAQFTPGDPKAGPAVAAGSPCTPTTALWDQTCTPDPAGGWTVSSNYETAFDNIDSQAADDFENDTGTVWDITSVTVLGGYSGTGSSVVDSALLQVYADAGTGLPGLLLHSETIDGALIGGRNNGVFVLNLNAPLTVSGGRYWVSVQANKPWQAGSDFRQWYWSESAAQALSPSVWRQPGNGYGKNCPSFLPRVPVCRQPTQSTSPDLRFKVEGGLSSNNPKPILTYLSPPSVPPGYPDFTLTVHGVNFVSGSQVLWNGMTLIPTSSSGTQLTVNIPTALLSDDDGAVPVQVVSPGPGGGSSDNIVIFYVRGRILLPLLNR